MNIVTSLVSLVIFGLFISLFYAPRHEIYDNKVDVLEEMAVKKSEGAKMGAQRSELEKTLKTYEDAFYAESAKYNEKQNALMPSSEPVAIEGLDEEELIIALEDLADMTQIDMKLRLPSEGVESNDPVADQTGTGTNPATPNDGSNFMDQDKTEQILETGKIERGTQSIINDIDPNNPNANATQNQDLINLNIDPNAIVDQIQNEVQGATPIDYYTFNIRGEYRSIMVFLFELRNLENPATISNFELVYNEGEGTTNIFPLSAKFTATFAGKEVSSDE